MTRLWAGLIAVATVASATTEAAEHPNVLFLSVDDLNDWVGCLGGHPQAETPNIDRLAERGVLFRHAFCAAPLCHPSRTAVLTGLRPSTTGIYGNLNWFRDLPDLQNWTTLPQHFREHGYTAWTGGKIFHQPRGKWSDPQSWDGQYSTAMGTQRPPEDNRYQHGLRSRFKNEILGRLLDWAPIQVAKEQTPDWRTASGAARFLEQNHEGPFFLACGIYRPHLQWYAPQEFFDLHPLETTKLPPYREDDLSDIPPRGRVMAGEEFRILKENGQWRRAVQGYLAASSFADACVGHVLDALASSRYAENTIVVLWGDHGYHVGDKDHIAKSALWDQATRTPLIIYVPEQLTSIQASRGRVCSRPVSLIDLYPTLIELCGLPPRTDLDGRSLVGLVQDPSADWPWPAIITHSPHWHGVNHAIRSERYHYIHYRDGTAELYDMQRDPYQWRNLATDPKQTQTLARLKEWLPKENAPHFRGGL